MNGNNLLFKLFCSFVTKKRLFDIFYGANYTVIHFFKCIFKMWMKLLEHLNCFHLFVPKISTVWHVLYCGLHHKIFFCKNYKNVNGIIEPFKQFFYDKMCGFFTSFIMQNTLRYDNLLILYDYFRTHCIFFYNEYYAKYWSIKNEISQVSQI